MSTPWMPLYVADYLQDTGHLSTVEHGAYMLLIMHYWANRGLPKEDARLARLVRLSDREWAKIRGTIAEFFDGDWQHGRIDAELVIADEKRDARAKAGQKGGFAASKSRRKPQQSYSNATAELYQPPSHSPTEEPSSSSAASAAPVYTDSRHELWGEGTAILGQLGVPEKSAKPNIGRWLRDAKDDAQAVLGAIQRARDNRVHDPIPWITRALKTPGTPNGKRPNGPHDTMLAGMAAALASRPDSRLFAGSDTCELGADTGPEEGNRGDHLRLAARRE